MMRGEDFYNGDREIGPGVEIFFYNGRERKKEKRKKRKGKRQNARTGVLNGIGTFTQFFCTSGGENWPWSGIFFHNGRERKKKTEKTEGKRLEGKDGSAN